MEQRVAIARPRVQNHRILLLDELFGWLDALTREKLDMEPPRLWRNQGFTPVMVACFKKTLDFKWLLIFYHRPKYRTQKRPKKGFANS